MERIVSDPHHITALSRVYSKLGWCAFWAQLIVGSLPVLLMGYLFAFASTPGPRVGFVLVEYLSIASLLALAFTTFWAFSYTKLAKKLLSPEPYVTYRRLVRSAWVGGVISIVGMVFSLTIMLIEVAHLLFYFLSAPQGGVPVIQTTGGESASWVSAVDMLSLMALVLTLTTELLFLVFSQYLLYRSLAAAAGSPDETVPPTA